LALRVAVTLRPVIPAAAPQTRKLLAGGELCDRIQLAGGTRPDPGAPDVPAVARWVAIPVGSEPRLTITAGTPVEAGTFNLPPVQSPLPDGDAPLPPFVKNMSIYAADAFFPGTLAAVTQRARVRGQPMILIELRPYQYNPVTGRLIAYPGLRVDVDTTAGFSPALRQRSAAGDARLRRLDPTVQTVLALPPEPASAPLSTGFGAEGQLCDFLIICAPDFEDAANTLAAWRMDEGMPTVVATIDETGSTTNEIQSYIRNAYNTWPVAPSYCLLFGDENTIPVIYSAESTPTDFHYGEMDGDLLSEIAMGRWPVRSAADARRLVADVIRYESRMLPANFYASVLLAAAFQDGEKRDAPDPDMPVDGYADRRFAKTSEDLYAGLSSNGLSPQRVYAAYDGLTGNHAAVNPTHWTTNSSYIFENDGAGGIPLPAGLLKANGFLWDGSASNITEAINNGCLIAVHRDHANVSGWTSPAFSKWHADDLTNGTMRPVVFSINCEAGDFTSFSDCFCERMLKNENGGAIGCVGSTRVSFSGRNDRMALGWMDAIWPSFLEDAGLPAAEGPALRRMGDIFNAGREYMLAYYSHNANTRIALKEFHWLGDPTLKIWTQTPQVMEVFCPGQMPFDLPELAVEIPEIDEVSVVASLGSRILATAVSSNGTAVLAFTPGDIPCPEPGETFLMRVTARKEGCLTVTNRVVITREHLDHYVSLNGGNVWPYTSWESAAHSPQDAVNAALPGDYVYVTNGVYETGGRRTPGATQSNRVYVTRGITLRSIGGAEVTKIRATARIWDDYRAAYVSDGGVIDGFTLYDGSTARKSTASPSYYKDSFGGNLYISGSGTAMNCIIKNGLAYAKGGNVMCYNGGTVANCALDNGQAFDQSTQHGDNAYLHYGGTLTNCVLGDAGSPVVPSRSAGRVKIAGNGRVFDSDIPSVETLYAAGARAERSVMRHASLKAGATLESCLISGGDHQGTGLSLSSYHGGIAIRNCTVVNCATAISASYDFALYNSIFARNTVEISQSETNGYARNCRLDDPGAFADTAGCITAAPRFAAPESGDFSLLPDSACIDAGDNGYVQGAKDLKGAPRIMRGTVDIGACEANYGLLPPLIEITGYDPVIAYDQEMCAVGGIHNGHVVGEIRYWRDSATPVSFPQHTSWTSPSIAIPPGPHTLHVSGTNLLGQFTQDSVPVHRLTFEEVQPYFAVTSAVSPVYIDAAGDSLPLTGTNRSAVAGEMIWFSANAPAVITPLPREGTLWSATLTALAIGLNPIALVATNSYGHSVTQRVDVYRLPMDTYVSLSGGHLFPFDNWAKAATNIQDAVDATCNYGAVWVSNGLYAAGGRLRSSAEAVVANRVVVERPVTVQSAFDRDATLIVGDAGTLRGVYLANGATLSGLIVSNCTNVTGGFENGAGILAELQSTVTNCIVTHCHGLSGGGIRATAALIADSHITDCTATGLGGGVYADGATRIDRCVIARNTSENGYGGVCAASDSVLRDCTVASNTTGGSGGGIRLATRSQAVGCSIHGNYAAADGGGVSLYGADTLLDRCRVTSNSAGNGGGGVSLALNTAWIRNCLITGNSAASYGGGVLVADSSSRVHNCTVSGNHAPEGGGVHGMAASATLRNCIVYGNTSDDTPAHGNWSCAESREMAMHHSCTLPTNGLAATDGSLESDPQFSAPAGGDYRLLPSSPCINAGSALDWMAAAADLDGNARIIGTFADMGAYEALRGDGWPFTDITNTVGEVAGDTETFTLAGTGTLHAAGMLLWSNALNGASSTIAATPVWSVEVPLAYGENWLSVTVTNLEGVAASDSHAVVRLPPGSGTPLIAITNTLTLVEPDEPFYILAGTCNEHVVGTLLWENSATLETGAAAAGNPWSTQPIMLFPGENLLSITGTNALGVAAGDTLLVTQLACGDGAPAIEISTPDQSVPRSQSEIAIDGINNAHVTGDLVWSNSLSGIRGSHAVWLGWPIPNIPLATGTNLITVSGENLHGAVASDSVTIVRSADISTAYVRLDGLHIAPFGTWSSAATNIQAALDAVGPEGVVVVSNGIYETGSALPAGHALPSRIAVPPGTRVRSVNGAAFTTIRGIAPPGPGAMRCAYLDSGAMLSGFTLENGATLDGFPPNWNDGCGGGVWAYGGTISNCVIRNCQASSEGGGARLENSASLVDSIVTLNSAGYSGGGIYASCAAIDRCSVVSNAVTEGFSSGGGIYGFMGVGITNCLVVGNTSGSNGAGIYAEGMMGMGESAIVHCTIAHNSATGEFSLGGGIYGRFFAVSNSIVYFNTAHSDPDIAAMEMSHASACCTSETAAYGVTWIGCITSPPLFAGGANYNLTTNSPCIDAVAALTALDLRHARRPVDGNLDAKAEADIGAFGEADRRNRPMPLPAFAAPPASDLRTCEMTTPR
jgi:hypothetical protein